MIDIVRTAISGPNKDQGNHFFHLWLLCNLILRQAEKNKSKMYLFYTFGKSVIYSSMCEKVR